jgi:hypothetical protein
VSRHPTPPTDDRRSERRPADGVPGVLPDGGTPSTDPDSRSHEAADEDAESRFRDLFVDITGTDELVERQRPEGSSRLVGAADDGETVAEYVTDAARDDGLDDTRSNAEPER